MTEEAYRALSECAHRRFVAWAISPRELRILECVLELSFAKLQMWAATPRLKLMADALALDKGGFSRALNSLLRKGALKLQRHRGEYLFQIALMCPTVPLRADRTPQTPTRAAVTAARAELLRINTIRDNGRADPVIADDGAFQPRLAMLMGPASEDADAEQVAFAAMMETSDSRFDQRIPSVGGSPETDRIPCANGQRIGASPDGNTRNVNPALCETPHRSTGNIPISDFGGGNSDDPDRKLGEMRSGLSEAQAHVLDQLVDQVRKGGHKIRPKALMKEFLQYAGPWRFRLTAFTYELQEAISDHRLLIKGSDHPLKWIYHQYKARGGLEAAEYRARVAKELDANLATTTG